MSTPAAPRSIQQYLEQLRGALAGEDPALVQDALYDAEEYLRAEVLSHPGKTESDVLELIASTYGAPDEVADAYRQTEKQVRTALAPPKRPVRRTAIGQFFGVYGDPRAWTSLFFMLLSIVTGVLYFSVTVTGASLSLGLLILIVGIPILLLFLGFERVLALVEGRIVEGLLGVRMPRRPRYPATGVPMLERIKDMLKDRRTYTTMLYFLLMLPLGVAYFTVAVVGVTVSAALVAAPFAFVLEDMGMIQLSSGVSWHPTPALGIVAAAGGVLMATLLLHLARGVGIVHGALAKHLLVAQSPTD
ncbi:MAG: sensor domain-containing protein [Gammaproteobacteria bacterium]|nr:sensor domain-containing protein [Gammaproteobacteria bacterium]